MISSKPMYSVFDIESQCGKKLKHRNKILTLIRKINPHQLLETSERWKELENKFEPGKELSDEEKNEVVNYSLGSIGSIDSIEYPLVQCTFSRIQTSSTLRILMVLKWCSSGTQVVLKWYSNLVLHIYYP